MPCFDGDGGGPPSDIQIALEDAEIGIAAEYELNFLFGNPRQFLFKPVFSELENLALRRRPPIAECAGKRTSSVGFPKNQPLLFADGFHQFIKQASTVG